MGGWNHTLIDQDENPMPRSSRFVPFPALSQYQIQLSEAYLIRLIDQGVLRLGIHYRLVASPGSHIRCY